MYVQGRLLSSRWKGDQVINSYGLPGGLFAELYDDVYATCITRLYAFTDTDCLAAYIPFVKRPNGL